jgi:hypothetical protein
MQNITSNGITGKVTYSVLLSEAHVQVYVEFLQRLVFLDCRHGQLCKSLDGKPQFMNYILFMYEAKSHDSSVGIVLG